MLTDDEKKHLKAVEIFRYEVRKSLVKRRRKTTREKFWELVNSSFGLWLLSTVIVGLAVSIYSNIKTSNDISAANAETMRKLTTEVSGRLQLFRISLTQLPPGQFYDYSYKQLAHMIDGTGIIDKGSASQDRPVFIFPEFQDRTLQSLLFEMERLTNDAKKAVIIKDGRIIIGRIKTKLSTMEDKPKEDFDNGFVQRMQQRAQTSPLAKLSAEDSIQMLAYQKQTGIQLEREAAYNRRTKIILDSLGNLLLKNSFLREQSDDPQSYKADE